MDFFNIDSPRHMSRAALLVNRLLFALMLAIVNTAPIVVIIVVVVDDASRIGSPGHIGHARPSVGRKLIVIMKKGRAGVFEPAVIQYAIKENRIMFKLVVKFCGIVLLLIVLFKGGGGRNLTVLNGNAWR